MATIDPPSLRSALGRFPTGVTVITTIDAAGEPIGLTANSYNSVSLDPPLVLWSLAKTALSMPAFSQCQAFAIHVLGADQQELAQRFATRGADKFAQLETRPGFGGVPVLDGCVAHFECELAQRIEGGDHVIFLGRVMHFEAGDQEPLVFHRGAFARVAPQGAVQP